MLKNHPNDLRAKTIIVIERAGWEMVLLLLKRTPQHCRLCNQAGKGQMGHIGSRASWMFDR